MKAKLLIAILFSFAISNICLGQSFQIGHTVIAFTDPSRSNRSVETEIFYPADAAGDDVPVTATTGNFPVLAFGHGFVMGYNAYENIWTDLVPKGFIMAFPKTEGGLSPSHLEFGKDLAFVIAELQTLADNSNSLFFNRIAPKSAVMGHSMGGGAAFLAAGLDSGIDALAVFAPAETNPSAIVAAATINIPALVFAGSNDCVTPPATNQIPMYDALQSSCKTYISINGASHCQMADSNFLCSLGEATCSPAATISREQQHAVITSFLSDWLESQLNSDCGAGANFNDNIASDARISFQKNCLLCESLSNIGFNQIQFQVYPNPFSNRIEITTHIQATYQFYLYDALMRKVLEKTFEDAIQIDNPELKRGIYFYTIEQSGIIVKSGKLIKE